MNLIPLVAVVGPTASGKTAVAIEIAKKYNGEIVSADSMQIYKGFPIGTAVPDKKERSGIPHHLMEVVSPEVTFSVADYVKIAHEIIEDIYKRDKVPILCGGTGLYYSSVVNNITFTKEPISADIRKKLTDEFNSKGIDCILEMLRKNDPAAADKFALEKNPRYIIRALELFISTGKTMEERVAESKAIVSPYKLTAIGLAYSDRSIIYGRTNKRVDIMLENGLLDEAKRAMAFKGGLSQAIGYKELALYINGELSLADAVEKLKKSTRNYSKRQMTWFKRDERINWIYADKTNSVVADAEKILKNNGF